MDESISDPRRHLIAPNSTIALTMMAFKPNHEPLTEWGFTHSESPVLAEELEGLDVPVGNEYGDDFEEFDKGDDLEPELAASVSTANREAADANSDAFDLHVSQVGSSGLTVGPFRTPIEPCTSANFNFNYTLGADVALDKIWLITDAITHLVGADVLDKMVKRFIRRWSNGIYSNANTGAGKPLPHGMIAGNPIRKRERADAWFGKAKLLDPAAKYPMFTTPCGYIGEQSGHTFSCGHGCLDIMTKII